MNLEYNSLSTGRSARWDLGAWKPDLPKSTLGGSSVAISGVVMVITI